MPDLTAAPCVGTWCLQRSGPLASTSDDYGYGIDGIESPPEHGKKSAWKDFLDKGHREANLAKL